MAAAYIVSLLTFPGFLFVVFLALFYEWVDRKLYARFQNRVGPWVTGPSGVLQPLADFIKLLSKEDIVPEGSDRLFFNALPVFTLAVVFTATLLLPVTGVGGLLSFEGDLIVAIALMTFICIIVCCSGLCSPSRFSIVGAERSLLQLLGYEIPLMLSIAGVAVSTGSITIADVVRAQAGGRWLIFGPNLLGLAVFLIASQAELERVPFDIPEAETEIVAGWLTEFSGRKLALFWLARDVELLYLSGLAATLFLGGPLGPVIPGLEPLFYTVYFLLKSILILVAFTAIKTVFARLRIDQMVEFSWKYLIPLAVLQLLLARVVV